MTASAVLRIGELGTSSLWLDDAWVGYAHRADYSDLLDIGLTAPGYIVGLALWFDAVGFSEFSAQLPAFLAGIAGPPMLFAVLRRRTRRPIATGTAVMLALVPIHLEYSTHVKQYTIEVLFGLAMLAAALTAIDRPTEARSWRRLSLISTAAVLFSFPLASIAAAAISASLISAVRRGGAALRLGAAWTAPTAIITAVWFLALVQHRLFDNLTRFWMAHYIDVDHGPRIAVESLLGRVHELLGHLFALPQPFTGAILGLAFATLLIRRPVVFIACTLPLFTAAVLASMERAPLGGGRTDIYLIPPLFLGAALGANELVELLGGLRSGRFAKRVVTGVGLAGLTMSVIAHDAPRPYPQEDIRPLIQHLEANRRPGDVVIVYYSSRFAYALYADVEAEVQPIESPYRVSFDDPLTVVQTNQRADPTQYLQFAETADALGGRIWLIGSHFAGDWDEIVRQIEEDLGRNRADRLQTEGADLLLFD